MTDNEKESEEEFKLAQQMKEYYCDKSGKEKNQLLAAKVLYQIGMIYRKRSPDKLSLIKSAGLFNGAIARNPSNVSQVKAKLIEICQHALLLAEAENQDVNLIEKAEQVKTAVNKMRNKVRTFLEALKKPKAKNAEELQKLIFNKMTAIKKINFEITKRYKHIMADLSQFCESTLGKPPCQYAVAGMGSLAREEITPYSDFEHIILLSDHNFCESHLKYFQWFSVVFHLVVLNMQETIIPSLNISSLNDEESKLGDWFYDTATPRGISFDGMMPHACKFPLGRSQPTKNKPFATELIKPVSEMLKYLTSEADLKHGYHLADILTKTCFVFGNESIFQQFQTGVQNSQTKTTKEERINDVKQQVKVDLDNFSTRFQLTKLKHKKTINIKQIVYRSTTIFIAALARIHNVFTNSSFSVIDEMAEIHRITPNTAIKLKCAIAIACEMRLRVYMEKDSQCDNAIDLNQDSIEKFLDIVGIASTINYFQIAYCLQCEVAKELNFTKLHFYSDPRLINITITLAFGLEMPSFSNNARKRFWDSNEFNFDKCIENLETIFEVNLREFNKGACFLNTTFSDQEQIKAIARFLKLAKIFDEALEFYQLLLHVHEKKIKHSNWNKEIAWINDQIGTCLNKLKKTAEALKYFNQALKIKQNLTRNIRKDRGIAFSFHNIGDCYITLRNFGDALNYLHKALEIKKITSRDRRKDRNIASTLHTIGFCHRQSQDCEKALTYFNQAIIIEYNAAIDVEKDKGIASTLHEIGFCHKELQNYDDALTYLNTALEIELNTTLRADKDKSIAVKYCTIGLLHYNLQNYKKALSYLNAELYIRKNATLNADEDKRIAKSLHNIRRCQFALHNHDEALDCFLEALEIRKNTKLNDEDNGDIAETSHCIGCLYCVMHNSNDALPYLNQALKMKQNISTNAEKDSDVAGILHLIDLCRRNLCDYSRAATNLDEVLEIDKKLTLDD